MPTTGETLVTDPVTAEVMAHAEWPHREAAARACVEISLLEASHDRALTFGEKAAEEAATRYLAKLALFQEEIITDPEMARARGVPLNKDCLVDFSVSSNFGHTELSSRKAAGGLWNQLVWSYLQEKGQADRYYRRRGYLKSPLEALTFTNGYAVERPTAFDLGSVIQLARRAEVMLAARYPQPNSESNISYILGGEFGPVKFQLLRQYLAYRLPTLKQA